VQQALRRDRHAGDLYVFCGKRCNLVRILWHDGIGLSLYAKRLERSRFIWPSPADCRFRRCRPVLPRRWRPEICVGLAHRDRELALPNEFAAITGSTNDFLDAMTCLGKVWMERQCVHVAGRRHIDGALHQSAPPGVYW
jgi:hypothetical protein